jgi:hypothetical protein
MTPSEVLFAIEKGYRSLKLFPANGATSVKMLKSFKEPFNGIRFCPERVQPVDLPAPAQRRLRGRHLGGAEQPDARPRLGSDHPAGPGGLRAVGQPGARCMSWACSPTIIASWRR